MEKLQNLPIKNQYLSPILHWSSVTKTVKCRDNQTTISISDLNGKYIRYCTFNYNVYFSTRIK